MQNKAKVAEIPWEECWVDADGVAQLTGYAKRYISEKLVKHRSFPTASRLGQGQRVWKVGEIIAWLESNREKHTGRPRHLS